MKMIMSRIKNIYAKIISNKKLLYGLSIIVLMLLTIALNLTYSALKSSSTNQAANITVNNMNYAMAINGTSGTIITATNNSVTKSTISITSLNSRDSKYELIYHVCSDSSCTSYIDKPNNMYIEYSSKTTDSINGTITSNGNKNIRIIVDNESSTTYYIKMDINAGYVYNSLALKNMITDEYNEEDITIAAIVDGSVSTTFPTTKYYTANVTCTLNGGASNASGTATWNGSKWVVNVTGVDTGRTICNVNFTTYDMTILKNAILGVRNDNVSASPATLPGRVVTGSGEAELTSSADDYGTSYYYRGAVTNNYVVFANMCWRIVRVTGNGAIKLVLYNYNPTSVSNPCASSADGTSYAFARYSGSTYTSVFNNNSNYNAYVGFMYGTANSSTYAAEQANTNKSVILSNLETWYASKLSSYSSYLADVIWCNDKSISSGTGYGTTTTYYGAAAETRVGYCNTTTCFYSSASPSFVCPNDANGGKLSKFTVADTTNGNAKLTYPIGLLTADEIAFAGQALSTTTTNTSYYLYNNTGGSTWWSMSPYAYRDTYTQTSNFYTYSYFNQSAVSSASALRPAISLVSTTKVTGSGTSSDPYVVTGY